MQTHLCVSPGPWDEAPLLLAWNRENQGRVVTLLFTEKALAAIM